jgi:hypothetical protein
MSTWCATHGRLGNTRLVTITRPRFHSFVGFLDTIHNPV